jgi:hypothetical protein
LAVLAFAELVYEGPGDPSLAWVQGGALAGGLLMLIVALLLDRRPPDEPDRGARFAQAASAGLVAWPALAATLLGLPPGPAIAFGVVLALLALAFVLAKRRRAPAGGVARQLGSALLALVGGTVVLLLLGMLLASFVADVPARAEATRKAIFDHDAGVETVNLPSCAPRAARVDVLRSAGAHPRLEGTGENVFFDAPGSDGRRQVYRLVVATGEVACLTCDEPGNNRHPAPNATGSVVLFDTDRYASWRRPGNTELQLLNTPAALRGVASRRITYSPGPDERPIFAPAANTLAWSRGEGGRYRAVSAGLVSGHGSLQVGGMGTIRHGGAEWIAPVAWAPDARTLVFARGNPFGPPRVDAVDPATEETVALGEHVVGSGGVSFNADGGWYVLASARRATVAGLLPDPLGFALAPALNSRNADKPSLFRETDVLWGPTDGEPRRIDLGETASWGWPTGVSLDADGKGFVLGQRRADPDSDGGNGMKERIVRVVLDCS